MGEGGGGGLLLKRHKFVDLKRHYLNLKSEVGISSKEMRMPVSGIVQAGPSLLIQEAISKTSVHTCLK